MHILSGAFKNRPVETPKKAITRPTSSKMRAQLCNICQHTIPDASFLDLFSGSGAMGLEALSRGARSACFIDYDRDACATIQKNISSLQVEDSCQVLCLDVLQGLQKITLSIERQQLSPFDIIFLDPPYFQKSKPELFVQVESILRFIDEHPILYSPSGRLFLEESRFAPVESIQLRNWSLASKRITGDACLYEHKLNQ